MDRSYLGVEGGLTIITPESPRLRVFKKGSSSYIKAMTKVLVPLALVLAT